MKPQVTLRAALTDPDLFGVELGGPTWHAWRSLLIGAMGEPLTADEALTFSALAGGQTPPTEPVDELWGVIGRRGGKTRAIALLSTYLGGLVDWRDALSPGERGVVLCIAPDVRQARGVLDYAEGALNASPACRQLLDNRNADTLTLTTGISIEVRSSSFRRIRGMTCIAVIGDEAAFWLSDESSNPDTEILAAARPLLATTGGPLVIISSPYARRGEVWNTYARHYGRKVDSRILVAQGASRTFNPSLPQSVVDKAMERDAASARAEYLGEFRTDVEGFLTREAVMACIESGVRERPPVRQWEYVCFVDPSGGSSDSMTAAIAHKENSTVVLDAIRENRPPFSPEAVVQEYADLAKNYRITKIISDRYGGEFAREPFRKHGLNWAPAEKPKSELYRDMLPLINSRACDLLDNDRLVFQFTGLERRTGVGVRDRIDHTPNGHDDLSNAVAGACVAAWAKSAADQVSYREWRTPAELRELADPLRDFRTKKRRYG